MTEGVGLSSASMAHLSRNPVVQCSLIAQSVSRSAGSAICLNGASCSNYFDVLNIKPQVHGVLWSTWQVRVESTGSCVKS